MNYKVFDDRIEIFDADCFNPKHICECGQMFRFWKNSNDDYTVISGENLAKIEKTSSGYTIFCDNPQYFIKYFDLDYDYNSAKKVLGKNPILASAITQGEGIRICHADPLETIFEFIISANNNILRIQKIVEKLCLIGEKKSCKWGEYYAFPSVQKLAEQSIEWYNGLGAGYRASYLKHTADYLANVNMDEICALDSAALYKWLLGLKGVGPKVASCILLFGFGRKEFFPVDTWVEQVYQNHFFVEQKSRKQIQEYFENMFGENSGLAQQYLFYAERGSAKK
jgi:N-glycosylase/DNA lyase